MNIYQILKIVSMVATGVFGVFGVVGDEKEDAVGKKRRQKIAIMGIIISAAFSLALYEMEAKKAKDDADNAGKQNLETQAKLDNSLKAAAEQRKLLGDSLDKSTALEQQLKSAETSLEGIVSSSRRAAEEQASIIRSQSTLISGEKKLRLWQIRSYFPLCPMGFNLEVIRYTNHHPEYEKYITSLRNYFIAAYSPKSSGDPGLEILYADILKKGIDNLDSSLPIPSDRLPDLMSDRGVYDLATFTMELEFTGDRPGKKIDFILLGDVAREGDHGPDPCNFELSVNFHRHIFSQLIYGQTRTRAQTNRPETPRGEPRQAQAARGGAYPFGCPYMPLLAVQGGKGGMEALRPRAGSPGYRGGGRFRRPRGALYLLCHLQECRPSHTGTRPDL